MTWLDKYLNITVRMYSEVEILLGVVDSSYRREVINVIFLLVKFYIHRQKLFHNCHVSLVHFLADLRVYLETERYNAKQLNRLTKFRKWQEILELLQ